MTVRLFLLLIPALLASLGVASILVSFLPFPFFRIFNRSLLAFGFLIVFFFQKHIRKKPFSALGLKGHGKALRDIFLGVSFSLLSFSAVTLVSLFFEFTVLHYHPPLLHKLINYFLGSIAIAFFEELFFRGLLLQTLMDDFSTALSVAFSSLIYSLVHFVRPLLLKPEDLSLFPAEALGLFLFSVILCYAVLRTRSLYLAMGLHGAFVLLLKLDGIVVDRLMREPAWIFGEERLVGGIVTHLGLLLAFPWIWHFTKDRGKDRPERKL